MMVFSQKIEKKYKGNRKIAGKIGEIYEAEMARYQALKDMEDRKKGQEK